MPFWDLYRSFTPDSDYVHESHMKRLQDMCLTCIGCNLDTINRVGQYLAPVHKEILLERLVFHDMLVPSYLPFVTYNLFCSALRRINFYRCDQINDGVLTQLGSSGCRLRYLTINRCANVTGKSL